MYINTKEIYFRILANLIPLFHLLWGLWGAVGAVLSLNGYYPKHPGAWTIYLVAMVGNGIYLKFFKHCPLTVLENKARRKYQTKLISIDSFTTYYMQKFTGIETTAPAAWIFIWSIYIANIVAFLMWR